MSGATQYTESQQAVIKQHGNNLLVSASAGSGKTTVLIERIMRKILAGTNIDQLLVVTFTNLAAKHMKQKLESQINKRISTLMAENSSETTASPVIRQLQQQLNLLGVANISTLDAFCLRIIQRYYYVIDLDPVFRLLTDNTEGLLIRDQVWDAVREQLYKKDGAKFDLLTANFSNDRSDDGLSRLIFRLFDFAQSTPKPQEWLDGLTKPYQIDDGPLTSSAFYQQQLLPLLEDNVDDMLQKLTQAQKIVTDFDLEPKSLDVLQSVATTLTTLRDQLATASWNELRAQINEFKVGRLKKTYKDDPDKTAHAKAMGTLIDGIKKQMATLSERYFAAEEQQVLDIMVGAKAIVQELVKATSQFGTAFAAEKRRRHVLDFSDLEHLTLQILTSDNESGQAALNQLRAQFDEVMVDEYQDINSLQESILQLLSRDEPGNMFMVGDVKQSIYQFRLADPLLFLHKYHDFADNPAHGDRIVLAENFRSVANVDHLTNLIFSQLMDAPVGQIDYDEDAYLKYGPKDYPTDMPQTTNLLLYQTETDAPAELTQEDETNFSIDDPSVGSITMVAQKILALKAQDKPIYDRGEGTYRPFRYSDVALLVPTRNHNLTIIDVFKRYHIPVVVNDAQNYFQTTEIRIMMSLLSIIDNPYQDIPLVAVLRSPIVGLDENQLVYLRIQNKTSDYFQAVQDFYHQYPGGPATEYGDQVFAKIETFLKQLGDFRDLARRNQIVTLIWQIYEQTGFLDYVGGMPAGKQRQANLHALYERAYSYEQGSFKGLFQFVRFIRRMQEKDQDLASAVAETDAEAVSVMTIHGSKGLEYPVIFVMDMDKQFNQTDTRSSALLDRQAGIGITYLDPETRVKYPTLPQIVTKQVVSQKMRAEEMRKLYVAITRAQQQLYLVGTIKDIDTATEKWRQAFTSDGRVLSAQARVATTNQLDWVGMTLIRHPAMRDYWGDEWPSYELTGDPTKFAIELGDATTIAADDTTTTTDEQLDAVQLVEQQVSIDVDHATREQLAALLNFHYPHQASTTTTAYQSVSEVKRIFEDPDTPLMNANPTVSRQRVRPTSRYVTGSLDLPQFLQTTQAPTSAEVGSATHLVMEQLDVTKPVDEAAVQATIDDLVAKRVLTTSVAERIAVETVVAFYQSDLGEQILAHPDKVHREVPFSLLIPARQIFDVDDQEDSKILIHGIIDGYLETDDGLILFDYKTDHVKQPADLKQRYAGQVKLYAEALNSMYHDTKVIQRYLYSLPQHVFVPVD
ncbi:helicase-exonuclease AddAB subunit AddA [Lactiplantibacillus pentosus]|uniref:helicase-exonuclease AddAB subunit AddA n=1 Tax=Lactiplantibacillus pentosus TaxID=1589 RepID=UPI00132F4FEF|nr:helicase-exonuclease AddAB subunit AddA [Lactiplantibacillus pentosus]MBQ0836639.1 helicase-exonuclease AddAB subunit AddA [Lactiplantibacillus pentosus]